MKAIKGNKVYTISDAEKASYVKQGFDITDDKGKVLQNGAGKKVSIEEFQALKEENEKLKKENEKLKKAAEK